jgi:hypothetical protein
MEEEVPTDSTEQRMMQAVYDFVHSQFPELTESGDMMNFSVKFKADKFGGGVWAAYLITDAEGTILHDEGDYFSS